SKAGLAEAGDPTIRGVSQDAPDHRAFPASCLARHDAFAVEPPRDLPNTKSLDGIHLIDAPHNASFGFIDKVCSRHLVGLPNATIAIGSAAHHADLARMCTVSLATTRSLQDLCSFVFRDH